MFISYPSYYFVFMHGLLRALAKRKSKSDFALIRSLLIATHHRAVKQAPMSAVLSQNQEVAMYVSDSGVSGIFINFFTH